MTKKTSRFLVNSALDKETLSKKGEIGQAFHKDRSTVWLDKEFALKNVLTRETIQNNLFATLLNCGYNEIFSKKKKKRS